MAGICEERVMRRFSIAMLALGIVILSLTVLWLLKPMERRRVHIIFTGISKGRLLPFTAKFAPYKDLQMGGAAHKAAKIKQLMASFAEDPFCVLSVGGEISGTADAYFTRGSAVIEALNFFHLNGMLIGNLEFTFGRSRLEELAKMAEFPMLSSNMVEEGDNVTPSFAVPELLIETTSGLKIGVLGLTPPATPEMTARTNIVGLRFLSPQEFLQTRAENLRRRGAALIVLLSQIDRERLTASEWNAIVKSKPDIVTMLDFNVDAPSPAIEDGILVKTVSGYNQGKELDLLDIDWIPNRGIVSYRGWRIPIECGSITPDSKVEAALNDILSEIVRIKAEKVGEFAADYERKYDSECPIGNLVSDAMRNYTNADVAFQNSGGIQSNIKQGIFTLGDLYNVLPFDNQVVAMSLSGRDLLEALTTSASLRRGALQISGGSYSFANRSSDDFELKEVLIGKNPIEPEKIYKVAVNSFLAEGGDDFRSFKRGRNCEYGPLQREVVKEYITNLSASAPIALTIEGRIRRETRVVTQ